MSTKEQKKYEKSSQKQHDKEAADRPERVLMRFSEQQFYNDLNNPIFEAGKVYELEGADWIHRWKKRGGEVVTEEQLEKEDKKALKGAEPVTKPDPMMEQTAKAPEMQTASVEDGVATIDGLENPEEQKDNKDHKEHKAHKGHKHK